MREKDQFVELPAALPSYLPFKLVQKHCAYLSRKQLLEWTIHGWVRTVKVNDAKQAGRLYNRDDIMNCLERLAAGRRPRAKRKKGGDQLD